MIHKLSTLISDQFEKHGIISNETKEVYTYGVEITISSLIGLIIAITIGIVFRCFTQSMIYYVIFVALRSITGGYHASTYLKCNIIFSLISLFTLLVSKAASEIQLSVGIITMFFLHAIAIFLWLAPVENPNKPIEKNKRIYLKLISVVIAIFLYILSILLYINQYNFESAIAIITVFVVSILCMIPLIQKGGKN